MSHNDVNADKLRRAVAAFETNAKRVGLIGEDCRLELTHEEFVGYALTHAGQPGTFVEGMDVRGMFSSRNVYSKLTIGTAVLRAVYRAQRDAQIEALVTTSEEHFQRAQDNVARAILAAD